MSAVGQRAHGTRKNEPVSTGPRHPAPEQYRVRHNPVTWVKGGGLTTVIFLLPMLLIFGAFSWYPIVRTVIMSLQHTNLVQPPTWVGLDNFRTVLHDPLLPIAVKNTLYFAFLALIFGYPIPLCAAVLMSEARRFRGLYSALAYLPVVIPPVVAVLLWKTFYDPSPTGVFNTVLGWAHLGPYPWLQSPQTAMPSLVLESTWANAGATVIIYLAALTAVNPELYEAASVDGASLWRKVWHITMPAAPRRAAADDDPADHRDRAGLPRAVPVHLRRAGQLDAHRAAADLRLRLRQLARRRLRQRDGAQPDAGRLPRSALVGLPARHAFLEHAMRTRTRPRTAEPHQGFVTASDWQRPGVKWGLGAALWLLLIGLVIVGLGPLLWLAKSAITPTTDTITHPISLFPHGSTWATCTRPGPTSTSTATSGTRLDGDRLLVRADRRCDHRRVRAVGAAAEVRQVLTGLVLVTLFVPVVVLLVPLYVEIVHPPLIHHSFIDSYWAIWLPAGASAFNVILVKRFFDNLPREIFEAARVDGADPFRLFWSSCCRCRKPILGVVSVFAILASWKDFLWPLLVLTNPDKQPLSVRLPTIQSQTELGVFLAALFIASLVPIIGVPDLPALVPARRQGSAGRSRAEAANALRSASPSIASPVSGSKKWRRFVLTTSRIGSPTAARVWDGRARRTSSPRPRSGRAPRLRATPSACRRRRGCAAGAHRPRTPRPRSPRAGRPGSRAGPRTPAALGERRPAPRRPRASSHRR